MYYYVYKIINNSNGKFYIGKRRNENPNVDTYMGSGKLIQLAIKKYGKDNFTKEILGVFNTNEEASELERKLVTKDIVESGNCYNMHEGGYGGFLHINNKSPDERVNFKALKQKIKSGEISPGGDKSMYFTEESYRKIKEGSKKGIETLKNKTEKEKQYTRNKISNSVTGSKNSQYGKRSYTNIETQEKKKFKETEVPKGWVLTKDLVESRREKSKRWYNDGNKNYYIVLPNPLIEELKLVKGRIR